MVTLIKNAKVLTPYEVLEGYGVIVRDHRIADIIKNDEVEKKEDKFFDEVIDAEGNYLSPGFIDIHNHGNFGHDVMEGTPEALDSIARFHLKHGVTGFLATTMTAPIEEIKLAVKTVANYMSFSGNPASMKSSGAQLLGIYLEGPYFSTAKKGAQLSQALKNPDVKELSDLINASGNTIKVVALAPELPGALEAISYLTSCGITVSAGHTDATFDQGKKAIDFGISQATHIFNGMRGFSHREPGIAGAVLTDERVSCEMICDGIHLHPATMQMVVKMKTRDKVILISDAMMACGLSDGEYTLGGQKVMIRNGESRLPDGTLAGSTLTLDRAVYNMVHKVGVPLCDAVRMATLNPARAIGISRKKGSIEIGKDADLVIFDNDIKIKKVITSW